MIEMPIRLTVEHGVEIGTGRGQHDSVCMDPVHTNPQHDVTQLKHTKQICYIQSTDCTYTHAPHGKGQY